MLVYDTITTLADSRFQLTLHDQYPGVITLQMRSTGKYIVNRGIGASNNDLN